MLRALASMMAAAVLCLLALPLAGCLVPEPSSYSKARTPLERAEHAYARVRLGAELVAPFLPSTSARRVHAGIALADAALAAAGDDATPDERLKALGKLAEAIAGIVDVVSQHH